MYPDCKFNGLPLDEPEPNKWCQLEVYNMTRRLFLNGQKGFGITVQETRNEKTYRYKG